MPIPSLLPARQRTPAPILPVPLVSIFLNRRSEGTRRAYATDLSDFARFTGATSNSEALASFTHLEAGQANMLALQYRQFLVSSGKSPATINRRLATLRSASKLARSIGAINWTLEVENEPARSYRDTTRPGLDGFRALLQNAEAHHTAAKAARDIAILRLLFDLALRRKEVVGIDLADIDFRTGQIQICGKGSRERIGLTIPEPTRQALLNWIQHRGSEAGPLFTNFDRAGKGNRLTGAAVYYIVRGLGRMAGIETRPHGLRHAAITEALDLMQGDVRSVQKFSRHRNLETLTIYDDNRRDIASDVANLVADSV